MLDKFNKMLAQDIINMNFIVTYFGCSFIAFIINVYGYFLGEECLSLFDILLCSLVLVLLIFFVVALFRFIYSSIKEWIVKNK